MSNRISHCFERAKQADRAVLGIFVSAGDPSEQASAAILDSLVENGADFIELGMPFSDPMADGPAIQAASLRAIKQGMTLQGTLDMVAALQNPSSRYATDLMGYYNPIYMYGTDAFITAALDAGVDGLIIVDLPPEEDGELWDGARAAGWISFVLSHQPHWATVCPWFWKKPVDLYIMLPSPALQAPKARQQIQLKLPSHGSVKKQICRLLPDLASEHQNKLPKWQRFLMVLWSDLLWCLSLNRPVLTKPRMQTRWQRRLAIIAAACQRR